MGGVFRSAVGSGTPPRFSSAKKLSAREKCRRASLCRRSPKKSTKRCPKRIRSFVVSLKSKQNLNQETKARIRKPKPKLNRGVERTTVHQRASSGSKSRSTTSNARRPFTANYLAGKSSGSRDQSRTGTSIPVAPMRRPTGE